MLTRPQAPLATAGRVWETTVCLFILNSSDPADVRLREHETGIAKTNGRG
jgi:hypothetical protein